MSQPRLREASRQDLPAILALLADDILGHSRDPGPPGRIEAAWDAIAADPNNILYVLDDAGRVIGCAQLTLIPGLARQGRLIAQVEGVRVAAGERGRGLGRALMRDLIAIARRKGCGIMQLTSDNRRLDAHRFYRDLGFQETHAVFKLPLEAAP